MKKTRKWLSEEKYGLALSIILIIAVGFIYFGIEGNAGGMNSQAKESSVFDGIQLKLAFNEKGEAKIFEHSLHPHSLPKCP